MILYVHMWYTRKVEKRLLDFPGYTKPIITDLTVSTSPYSMKLTDIFLVEKH